MKTPPHGATLYWAHQAVFNRTPNDKCIGVAVAYDMTVIAKHEDPSDTAVRRRWKNQERYRSLTI
ncbi:hypothetical protein ACFQUU_13140 [Herbaspirillum sp. GCM10030257]